MFIAFCDVHALLLLRWLNSTNMTLLNDRISKKRLQKHIDAPSLHGPSHDMQLTDER